MSVVELSANGTSVEIEEVNEQRPARAGGLDWLPDIEGNVVAYERIAGPVECPIQGRVKSKTEIELLEAMVPFEITMTERDGTASAGWRIKTDPRPTARKKDGDSPDYAVQLTLWRLP